MRPMVNGKGSFDEAVKRAKKLVQLRGDGQYYVRGTYTARNLDFGNDVLALADEGFEQLSIEPVVLEENSPFALTKEMLPRYSPSTTALPKSTSNGAGTARG